MIERRGGGEGRMGTLGIGGGKGGKRMGEEEGGEDGERVIERMVEEDGRMAVHATISSVELAQLMSSLTSATRSLIPLAFNSFVVMALLGFVQKHVWKSDRYGRGLLVLLNF